MEDTTFLLLLFFIENKTIHMKWQSLFSLKNNNNGHILSSATILLDAYEA